MNYTFAEGAYVLGETSKYLKRKKIRYYTTPSNRENVPSIMGTKFSLCKVEFYVLISKQKRYIYTTEHKEWTPRPEQDPIPLERLTQRSVRGIKNTYNFKKRNIHRKKRKNGTARPDSKGLDGPEFVKNCCPLILDWYNNAKRTHSRDERKYLWHVHDGSSAWGSKVVAEWMRVSGHEITNMPLGVTFSVFLLHFDFKFIFLGYLRL